jgi:hypothetical protein
MGRAATESCRGPLIRRQRFDRRDWSGAFYPTVQPTSVRVRRRARLSACSLDNYAAPWTPTTQPLKPTSPYRRDQVR